MSGETKASAALAAPDIVRPAPELAIVVPTFQERENVPQLIERLRRLLSGLGRSMLEQNRLADAEQTLQRAKEIAAKAFAADSPQLAAANSSLGRVLMAQRRTSEAAPLLRESYPILLQAQGENAVITQRTREALAQLDKNIR